MSSAAYDDHTEPSVADEIRRVLPGRMTEAEYVAFEVSSETRHEYFGGEVVAMVGARRVHHIVAMDIGVALHAAAKAHGCRVTLEGPRLRISSKRHFYPDIMVVCADEPDDPLIEEAPCLIVEVLSPSTSSYDRGPKRISYLDIPSLRHLLLVDIDGGIIEHHARVSADAPWVFGVSGAGDVIEFHCPPGASLDVSAILGVHALSMNIDDDPEPAP